MENNKLLNWYMISTVSGKEDKVKESLENRINSFELQKSFGDIKIFKSPYLSPRDIEKKRLGEKYNIKMANIYKGYIFIKMEMNDEVWFMVRNTQYVTGLVGSSGKGAKPTPISESSIQKMLKNEKKLTKEFEATKDKIGFDVGQFVEVIDGPFKDENGIVLDNDDEHRFAVVELEIFGKKTPTQLEHSVLKLLK